MDTRLKKILIVDDEERLTELLKFKLETKGDYSVRTENLGARVRDTALEFVPDLVVLDVMMPDMHGDDVAAMLREEPRFENLPILFLTAIVCKEEVEQAGPTIGSHCFMAKPVGIDELTEQIESMLR